MKATPKKNKKIQPAAQPSAITEQKNSLKRYYYLFGLIAFLLFANTLGHGYNMDDGMVTSNHRLTSKGLSAISEIFTSPYYSDAMGYAYGYRPIVHLSFALEHELFGQKPGAGHFINVILFALSVVLFFKLLVKWAGEKNILFAGIATLLFAIHPIHTEVVASLKNRDEILAFLFSIWAGLSAYKYVTKGKWTSIVSIFLLFSLAMLSKKSVYPMAFILPAAFLLNREITIKQLLVLALPFAIPAAVIGSELQPGRMLSMAIIPLVSLATLYFIKKELLVKQLGVKEICSHWLVPALLIVLVCAGSLFVSAWLTLLLVPLAAWLLWLNTKAGIAVMLLSITFINETIYRDMVFSLLIAVIAIGYLIHVYLTTKKIPLVWLIVGLLSVAYFLYYHHNPGDFAVLSSFAVLFWLAHTYTLAALLLPVAAITVGIVLNGKLNFYSLTVLVTGLFLFLSKRTSNTSLLRYSLPVGLALAFLFAGGNLFVKNTVQTAATHQSISTTASNTSSFLKEGRQLLYAENTLVAPHSQEEKAATGFLALGEYLRLHVFPKELSFYYGYATMKTVRLNHPVVIVSIIVHLLLLIIAVWQIKKRPLITIGVMWYLLSILLFSNWIELVAGMVGERLAFTASAGFCILIPSLLYWLKPDFNLRKPGIAGAVLGIILVLFAGRTFIRNADWKDTMTLMKHDIKHLENSAQANNMYAMTLMSESIKDPRLSAPQRLEMQRTAISHFDKATEIWPGFFNAYIDKGRATMITKDYEQGIQALKKAVAIDPQNTLPYYVLLEITELKGDYKAYLASAEQLFNKEPNDYAYGVMARGYFLMQEYVKSREILLDGLKKYPDSGILLNNLNIVNQKLK